MWWDEHDDRDRDLDHAFEVRCEGCGAVSLNIDEGPCSCGSSSQSFRADDARRWNRYAERQGW